MGLVVLSHLAVVVLNDFKIFAASGEIYGIQGRYLLPVVAGQMIFLVLGAEFLLPQETSKTKTPITITFIAYPLIRMLIQLLATIDDMAIQFFND